MEIKNRVCDVLVIGGSLEGCVAAVSAARKGKSVILLEKNGSLGGMSTNGLDSWMDPAKNETVNGIRNELLKRLECEDGEKGTIYPDQKMKVVLGEWLRDEGVTVLTHVFVSLPIWENGRIAGFTANGKTEPFHICSKVTIDATDIMETAGLCGLTMSGNKNAFSGAVKCNGCDFSAFEGIDEIQIGNDSILRLPIDFKAEISGVRYSCAMPRVIVRRDSGEILISDLVCEVDDLSPLTLSKAQMGMRRFAYSLRDMLRKEVFALRGLNIIHVAPKLNLYGVREYTLAPEGLIFLNNDGKAYSNSLAIEKGSLSLS